MYTVVSRDDHFIVLCPNGEVQHSAWLTRDKAEQEAAKVNRRLPSRASDDLGSVVIA